MHSVYHDKYLEYAWELTSVDRIPDQTIIQTVSYRFPGCFPIFSCVQQCELSDETFNHFQDRSAGTLNIHDAHFQSEFVGDKASTGSFIRLNAEWKPNIRL
ncbi:hypothetical protein NPIL_195771 [Nephila pilipes]|uniref:Uncharacterized protein n=1 Tax=Nephila pilipes TaxID=299642 RepID=A0A8X6TH53_NEPPI|nr:hypothetical protein NPIL_195771 [Nephila pilipes]